MFTNKSVLFILMSIAMLTWGVAWTCAKIVNQYLNYNNKLISWSTEVKSIFNNVNFEILEIDLNNSNL